MEKMMPHYVFYIFMGILLSAHSALFLYYYYYLVRNHKKAQGEIVSLEHSNDMLMRRIIVPVVSFRTENDSIVENQPEHSCFIALNGFYPEGHVTVYYKAEFPESFVIECRTELIANWVTIALTLCAIVWLCNL